MLRNVAQVMSEARTKRQQEEETKQEKLKAEAKARVEEEHKAKMKKKGKEKVEEEIGPPIKEVTAQDRQEVMTKLKQALDKRSKCVEATTSDKLEGILESFVAYYRNLKAKDQ